MGFVSFHAYAADNLDREPKLIELRFCTLDNVLMVKASLFAWAW